MKKAFLAIIVLCLTGASVFAQVSIPKFGKGIQMMAEDSSIYLKLGFRFQTLLVNDWDGEETGFSNLDNHNSAFFVRRSRIKMNGWALNKNFKYKAELALSNRDNGGGDSDAFSNAANIILDAWVEYKFYKGLSLRVGQMKLPGNRERVISSGNLQFVDRSRLNSRYTLDRDVAFMFIHKHRLGESFVVRELLAISSGEGKNITAGNIGGFGYSARIEFLPFGEFQSKGDYIGAAIKREEKPKLSVALTYDINDRAGRTRGQKGSFLPDDAPLQTLSSVFIDAMFKYEAFSFMMEYADRKTDADSPRVFLESDQPVGTYYIGSGLNLQAGYMFKNNWELAARWTDIKPHEDVASDEVQYTFGLSKYIVGHKLKVQTDVTFRERDNSNNEFQQRLQVDFHF